MSAQKEQAKLQVLNSLLAEHVSLDQAATLMGVSARLLAAYREEGAAALAHGNRVNDQELGTGRSRNNQDL